MCVGGGGGVRYCQISFVNEAKTFDDPGRENSTKISVKKKRRKNLVEEKEIDR